MSKRPFVLLAMASASLTAAPAAAQDYALPPLEPMPSANQSASAVQTATAAQLPPVYQAPRTQAPVQARVQAPVQAPVQNMHPERGSHDGEWSHGSHYEGGHHGSTSHHGQPHRKFAYTPQQRAWWISECQRRMSYAYASHDSYRDYGRRGRDSNLEGAAIGAVVGGIAGNRIAGRGDRTEGTIIGAVGGAVLGAAIDSATSNRGETVTRGYDGYGDDGGYCENYLAAYESGAFGYGHTYAQPMIHRSIDSHHNCGCKHAHHGHHGKTCKKIVTEKEYWEEVPVEHEVVEEVRYIKQPVRTKTRYVKQPVKTRYVKQPAKTRYVKQPSRSVKSVK